MWEDSDHSRNLSKYFHRNNFEAHTNLRALKDNAIKLCGKELCEDIKKQGISANTDKFWEIINKHLGIPNNAYEKKQTQEEAKKQVEQERLLAKKSKVYSKTRKDWEISIYELPHSEIFGKVFISECTRQTGIQLSTEISSYSPKSSQEAYSVACSKIDKYEDNEKRLERYKLLKPFYLMLLYLSGWDKHSDCHKKENFIGVEFWNGLDYDILNQLETEDLIAFSSTKKTLYLNKKAMKEARETLSQVNLDGINQLLEQRDHHEEYISYLE